MLIKSIEIHNFRCFHNTYVKGFSYINLFGGKNNAGKTALLESLLLLNEPVNQSLALLLKFRRIDSDFMKAMPQRAWDNFFFKQLKETEITLIAETSDKKIQNVAISCSESVEEFINLVQNDKENDDHDLLTFASSLSNKEAIKSALQIKSSFDNGPSHQHVLVASSNGVMGRGVPFPLVKTFFIPASFKLANEELAQEFDKAKLEDLSDLLLEAFKLIDSTIEKVDTFKIGKSAIFIKRKEESFMPLTLFGDAMNKIADIILRVINNKNSVILVDEIENGIHHESQEKLWKMLFDLSIKYNVQVFATTHSAEMITAFKNVILKDDLQEEGRYFEIARHVVTKEVSVQKIPVLALEEKLITHKPIRGEYK